MGLLEQTYKKKEEQLKQNLTLSQEITRKQEGRMAEMNNALLQEKQQDNILTVKGLERFRADEIQEEMMARYKTSQRQRDASASDRNIRKRAEKKTAQAMKLKKMLQELGNTGKSFDEVVRANYTIFRLNTFRKSKNPNMSDDDARKIEALKKQAPKAYERLLKLEHVLSLLGQKREKYQELYEFALREKQQAGNEWAYITQMSSMVTYAPTINAETERQQLENRRKEVEPGEKHRRDKFTELDQTYQDELKENLKPMKVNLEANTEQLEKKPFLEDHEVMDYVLSKQMEKIRQRDPGATPETVKEIVKEYLKKLAEKSALRFRVSTDAATSILNSRYRSAYDGKSGKYKTLMEKQFSANTQNKTYESFAFGILGGQNAKEFSGYGGDDACKQYGTVSIKLKKDKMRGRVTFTCGNSMGQKKDSKFLTPPDFYDIKKARDVFGEPDLGNCGDNLYDIYFRAKELRKNGYENMGSAEQEALQVINDKEFQKYFEAQFHGQVGAAEIEELTVVLSKKEGSDEKWDFSKKEDLEQIKKLPNVKKIYDSVNIVNKNPVEYGRTAEDGEMKVTLWDCNGNTLTFDDLKFIMEK